MFHTVYVCVCFSLVTVMVENETEEVEFLWKRFVSVSGYYWFASSQSCSVVQL